MRVADSGCPTCVEKYTYKRELLLGERHQLHCERGALLGKRE